jgi:hypothetical protein
MLKTDSALFEFPPDTSTIMVAGDLHGDWEAFSDLVEVWKKKSGAYLVCLGDYADRGEQGVEIIEVLTELISTQDKVIAIKGNHEDYPESGFPTFGPWDLMDEVRRKRGPWSEYFESRFKPFMQQLFLAAIWPGQALLVHGGVSNKLQDVNSLKQPSPELEKDLLWSDPHEDAGEKPNSRGSGVKFGPDITDRILKQLNIKLLIRSHEPYLAKEGPFYSQGGRVITLSSTRVFQGRPFYLELSLQNQSLNSQTVYL